MAYRVIFLRETDQDIAEAIAWYNDIGEGLAQRFRADLAALIPSLEDNPYIFQEASPGIRIGLTKRFQFRLVYEIKDRSVLVVAVMHPKRHDRRWKQRTSNRS